MQHIAVLDFGSQYTHLIARRVRELGVLAKIYSPDVAAADLPADVCGIILSGGPQSVYDKNALTMDEAILKLGKPILGLCYGHQLLAHLSGGDVKPGKTREYGRAQLNQLLSRPAPQNAGPGRDPLYCEQPSTSGLSPAFAKGGAGSRQQLNIFFGIPNHTTVWMSHGDTVVKLPDGFEVIGSTDDCAVAAMTNKRQQIFGLQFHPEVHHTTCGREILKNFIFSICAAEPNWRIDNLLDDIIDKIKAQAGDKKIFLLVSGGVDSTVCFALLERALGKKRVFGLHIDTGFMRKDESKEIVAMLARAGYDNLHVVDASQTFYERLRAVCDPEQKRKIIGQTFLDVKDEAAAKLKLNPDERLLAQGTIYPDTIETGGTRHADRIKTHHNRVDAIQKLIAAGKIIEPLADFYKDEVRALGGLLGLPDELINRHPFPGPGLAIRVLCHCEPPKALAKGGEAILSTHSGRLSDCFVVPLRGAPRNDIYCQLLPIRSVGVQGDNRTYAHPIAIWEESDWNKLDHISHQITNANRDINRVLLLLNPDTASVIPAQAGIQTTSDELDSLPAFAGTKGRGNDKKRKPDAMPRYDLYNRTLTPKRIELLREIDAMVTKEIKTAGVYDTLWQCPVVLIPLGCDNKESIVLRPVISQEAMTANFARFRKNLINKIVERVLATKQISYIFYDITNKPPGTIEWE